MGVAFIYIRRDCERVGGGGGRGFIYCYPDDGAIVLTYIDKQKSNRKPETNQRWNTPGI